MTTINTVLGPCRPEDLGLTLMHEHLIIGLPGWDADTAAPPFQRGDVLKRCIDRMEELKALGVRTILDPCPADGGRDAEFMAEVARATGVHIICATGLYKEDLGATGYFPTARSLRKNLGQKNNPIASRSRRPVSGLYRNDTSRACRRSCHNCSWHHRCRCTSLSG